MEMLCLPHELELKSHREGNPTFFFSSNAHLGLRVLYLFVTHLKNFLFSLRYGAYENVRNY